MISSKRKRFSRHLKEPFGKAGLTVAILALVLAMVGGAWAAGALSSKQKKEVTTIAKKYAGKPGAPGANGTNGQNGAPGESVTLAAAGSCPEGGTKVTVGGNSKEICNGVKGTNGTNGKPVVVSATAPSCFEGGITVEVEGSGVKHEVCNGEEGPQGPQGEPWTAGGTLPHNATETGTWAVTAIPVGYELHNSALAQMSFPIQLTAPLPEEHVHVIAFGVKSGTGTGTLTSGSNIVTNVNTGSGEFSQYSFITGAGIPANTTIEKVISSTELELSEEATASGTGVALTAGLPTGCKGNVEHPEADPGYLCVFESRRREETFNFGSNVKEGRVIRPAIESFAIGAGRTGAMVWLWSAESGQRIDQFGTWAVTG
jgi:hypothetical protein